MNSDSDDYSDSDATYFSGSDDDDADGDFGVEADGVLLEKWIPPLFYLAKGHLQTIQNDVNKLENVCLACWEKGTCPHPFFVGALCQQCKERLLRTMFSKTVDGFHLYCTICGSKSNVCVSCSNDKCYRKYCVNCLNIWTDHSDKLIKNSDKWFCFLCLPEPNQILKAHHNWAQKVLHFHEPLAVYASRALYWKRQPLRVLSLFDGIGTGLVALRNLGIEVEVYYASEVLTAAAAVSRTRLGGVLQHIGSVGEVTQQRLEEISPIHLLIGGSPCNDFSAINRFPKDFYDPRGYSMHFFDFVRVLNLMRKINGQYQHLLWLFENVASMPQHYRETISRHLDCQPAVIDAKNFSPQLRRRLFWGNIPGLLTVHEQQLTQDGESLSLEKSLMPNSGRRAAQEKIRTLTTNTNSLLQGRTENCKSSRDLASLFPVRFSFQQDELKSIDVENGVAKKPNKGKMGYRKGKNVGESRSDHLQ
ncbi:DNA (cytosine-5)-methyltransferase 3B-like isoform X2 [Daphnia pulex]|nr:DNA (cytosine-5)-methyltransferase 3B-like isoform X2 [Daphnia pulex]